MVTAIAESGLVAPELLRGHLAPAPRTLIDIIRNTAANHPETTALDDGTCCLSYRQLMQSVDDTAARLRATGIGRGDRVGISIPSGTADLYISILAVLAAGAAYVPVDFDDPDDRAALVFGEAAVALVIGSDGAFEQRIPRWRDEPTDSVPTPDDDAWIIFTSGSTGTPKGVAVQHRSAAAWVDAEARMFLRQPGVAPLGPADRVLAGLSVAFDASCEEMWLAWRHGAALVPAPRALIRSGADLCDWLRQREITVVSTVPTLAALWPPDRLDRIRLLIFGGEICPPELGSRLVAPGREVWNTYGPTETTVVACGALLTGTEPVRIGLPIDGCDLAVVNQCDQQVAEGDVGEMVIGGVGLGRYLDATLDARKYAAMPELGWARGYRTGDLVRYEAAGLVYLGRTDDQIKLGGRRIELGEIDAALQALPGVAAAAATVRTNPAGGQVLVGYLVVDDPGSFSTVVADAWLRDRLPAGTVPMLTVVAELPTRTSGKVDRDALPWPLLRTAAPDRPKLDGTAGWIATQWARTLGVPVNDADDHFFSSGGSSLSAAILVSALRTRFPDATVGDIYAHPTPASLARRLDNSRPVTPVTTRSIRPTPRRAQVIQSVLAVPLAAGAGLRWLVLVLALNNLLGTFAIVRWAPTVSWWWVVVGALVLLTPPGVMTTTVVIARLLLFRLEPGQYPRGGSVHLRIWAVERFAEALGASSLIGAPLVSYYARGLGARIGRDTDLHSLPPVTGMLTLGRGCSINTEVDLAGHWLDGDVLHVGPITVGAGASVGSRSVLMPGTVIGANAHVAAGSAVSGRIGSGEHWAGSPATRTTPRTQDWPTERPARGWRWDAAYAVGAVVITLLPIVAAIPGILVLTESLAAEPTPGRALATAALMIPLVTLLTLAVFLALTATAVRLLGIGLTEGFHAVRGRIGWQVWCTEKLMDLARTVGYPLYSSMLTPAWLRLLGAKIGTGVEASTVLILPRMTTVGSGAFLADDTMVGSYELSGGWLRIQRSKVGKKAFLGNSGMTAPGRQVPKRGLVAVLSAAPARAKTGTSWLGSPPALLPRVRTETDTSRTYTPSRRLKIARALIELCRLVPVMISVALGLGVLAGLELLLGSAGLLGAALLAGVPLLATGALGLLIATLAKWLLVGRLKVVDHPLWSSFVWRNELADVFVEVVGATWLPKGATGAPMLTWWLRGLGAKLGRGVWLETYWLPEADLVRVGDGATVNRGCVLQTHLFHDRIMSMDTVSVAAGATLGPHSILLPAATLERNATVGPASLIMRGDSVPTGSRWTGNPIAPWVTEPPPTPATAAPPPGTTAA